jgi:hypothetical protein
MVGGDDLVIVLVEMSVARLFVYPTFDFLMSRPEN